MTTSSEIPEGIKLLRSGAVNFIDGHGSQCILLAGGEKLHLVTAQFGALSIPKSVIDWVFERDEERANAAGNGSASTNGG
jgi:hypothetical protein